MKLSFKSWKLEKSLVTDKGLFKAYGEKARKIKQRISELRSAENLETVKRLPALRLHQHQGKDKGRWSIDIWKNWRILFTIDMEPIPRKDDDGIDLSRITDIRIESVEDPH